jgi:hypothetical protein
VAVVTVRAPWTLQPCRMIAVIVNGKSCIVLSIDLPPSWVSARHRLMVSRANAIAARGRGEWLHPPTHVATSKLVGRQRG